MPLRFSGMPTSAESFLTAKTLGEIDLTGGGGLSIYRELNPTDAEVPDEPFHRMFERQAEANGWRTAVIAGGEEVTYAQLNALANRAAHALLARGVRCDEIIGLLVPRTKEVFIGELGILKAGGAFLPMVPEYPDDRIDYCLQDAGCRFVLTTRGIAEARADFFRGKPYEALTFEEITAEPCGAA